MAERNEEKLKDTKDTLEQLAVLARESANSTHQKETLIRSLC